MVFPGRFQRVPSVRRSCAGGGNVVASYKFCPEHLRSSSPTSPRIQAGVTLLILLVLPHRRRITYRFDSSSLAILVSTQPSIDRFLCPCRSLLLSVLLRHNHFVLVGLHDLVLCHFRLTSHFDPLYRLLMSILYGMYTDSMIFQSEKWVIYAQNISSSI